MSTSNKGSSGAATAAEVASASSFSSSSSVAAVSSAVAVGGTERGNNHNAAVEADGTVTDLDQSLAAVQHDPHADRIKFAHDSVREREEKLLDESQVNFEKFLDWLRLNRAHFPDLYFKVYAPNVRGVHAKQTLPALHRFMEIPIKCLITDDLARSTPVGQALKDIEHQLSVPNHCQIIVYMLLTRADGNSFFQPYYDVLPSDFDNFPIFWTKEEMSWLQGSSLVKQIEDRKRSMRSDYDHICKHIKEFRQFSFEEFLWCRTAVGSRNFSITVRGQKRTAMVPQADMLNHFRPRECSWTYDNVLQAFTMTSLKKIGHGAQVFDSYGKKCNSKFLLHYGFTIESNREHDGICQNELLLNFRIEPDDPHFSARRSFINATRHFAVTMNATDDGTAQCLNYLRVKHATPEELEGMSSRFSRKGPVSLNNEVKTFKALAGAARAQLRKYPTTMEEDDELLQEGALDPFSNRRHAVIIIRGEKEICHFFIRLYQVIKGLLAVPSKQGHDADTRQVRTNRVSTHFNGSTDIDRLVRDIHRDLLAKGL